MYRYLAESFFREISAQALIPSSELNSFLKNFAASASDATMKSICRNVTDPKCAIKMNHFDVLLSNSQTRAAIYKELRISESELPYPVTATCKSNYIYGYLSNSAHSPDSPILYLRSDENGQFRTFAEFLAHRFQMKVDFYDPESAAAGYDDISSETSTAVPSFASSDKSTPEAAQALFRQISIPVHPQSSITSVEKQEDFNRTDLEGDVSNEMQNTEAAGTAGAC